MNNRAATNTADSSKARFAGETARLDFALDFRTEKQDDEWESGCKAMRAKPHVSIDLTAGESQYTKVALDRKRVGLHLS